MKSSLITQVYLQTYKYIQQSFAYLPSARYIAFYDSLLPLFSRFLKEDTRYKYDSCIFAYTQIVKFIHVCFKSLYLKKKIIY